MNGIAEVGLSSWLICSKENDNFSRRLRTSRCSENSTLNTLNIFQVFKQEQLLGEGKRSTVTGSVDSTIDRMCAHPRKTAGLFYEMEVISAHKNIFDHPYHRSTLLDYTEVLAEPANCKGGTPFSHRISIFAESSRFLASSRTNTRPHCIFLVISSLQIPHKR